MPAKHRKGFTLVELLVVIVIIGILAAIAIPKFAATKDKAKLASVKTDLRNLMTAQEAYYSDFARYGALSATLFAPSSGNSWVASGTAVSYTGTVTNTSITTPPNTCTVTVGDGSGSDGKIVCS
jgi:prepilin-type N-terminal cleavage/methylation domain-containing protein